MVSLPIADVDVECNLHPFEYTSEVETVGDSWEVEAYDQDDELGCMHVDGEYADDTDHTESASSTPKKKVRLDSAHRKAPKVKEEAFVVHPICYNSDEFFE